MLTITTWEDADGQVCYAVHKIEDDGVTTTDMTDHYAVHPLVVQDGETVFAGFHVGKRVDPADIIRGDDDGKQAVRC